MARERIKIKKITKFSPMVLEEIKEDIRALNSSILIISQKMKYLVRNEKILGRNLIVLNKKIKALEEKIETGAGGAGGIGLREKESILSRLDEMSDKLSELESIVIDLRQSAATKEELQELKYVIDTIKPLEFVTTDQVKELIKKGKK